MKNLFNDISQEEKNRILEMHSSKKSIIKEDSPINGVSSFKAKATVEDDMMMEFPIVEFSYGGFGVTMFIKHPTNGKLLNVENFEGPIFEGSKQVFRDSQNLFSYVRRIKISGM